MMDEAMSPGTSIWGMLGSLLDMVPTPANVRSGALPGARTQGGQNTHFNKYRTSVSRNNTELISNSKAVDAVYHSRPRHSLS